MSIFVFWLSDPRMIMSSVYVPVFRIIFRRFGLAIIFIRLTVAYRKQTCFYLFLKCIIFVTRIVSLCVFRNKIMQNDSFAKYVGKVFWLPSVSTISIPNNCHLSVSRRQWINTDNSISDFPISHRYSIRVQYLHYTINNIIDNIVSM